MKKNVTIMAALGIFALGTSEIISTSDGHGGGTRFPSGITKKTGANGGSTCTQCHGGTVNSGQGNITITLPEFPNFKYKLGQEYTIIVTVNDENAVKYGLDFTALKSGDTIQKGTLIAGTNTKVLNGEITHTAPSDSKTFTFKWKAPDKVDAAGAASNITFYVAALAANGNGQKTGDLVYTTNRVVTWDNSSSSVDEPTGFGTKQLSVFPNPATDFINVAYTLEEANLVTIQLTNLNGQLVEILAVEKQPAGSQNKLLKLPAGISEGIYLLTIKGEGANIYNKLVIKK